MEDFPLNKAHREYRKAETFESKGEIEKAIACHEIAASFLTKSLPLTRNILVFKNLQLQIKYHTNRINFLQCRERLKQMRGIMNQGMPGSAGSSVSASSNCPIRDTSPQPCRNLLMEQIDRIEERLEELMDLLHKIAFKPVDTKQEDGDDSFNSDRSSSLPTNQKGDASYVLNELHSLQKQYFQLTRRVCSEMLGLEKENNILQLEVKQLQSRLDEVEKDRRRLQEISSSCLSNSTPSPELPPLDLPPFYLASSTVDNS